MTTQLKFNKMKPLAQEIFGLELVRSGKQFKLLDGDVALGEAHGDLWTLRDIKAMFQEWLIHPDAYDFFSPEFRAKLGFNSPVQCLSDKEVADTVEFIVDEIRVDDMKLDFPRSSGHAGVILWTSHALVDTPELFLDFPRSSGHAGVILRAQEEVQ